MKLHAKRAIVTGSSTGIGRSIALELTAEGADVVVSARSADAVNAVVDEIRAKGGSAIANIGAIDNEANATALVADCVEHFGGSDIVVNNAGIFSGESIGPLDGCCTELWRQTFAVNVDGPLLLCTAALPHPKVEA